MTTSRGRAKGVTALLVMISFLASYACTLLLPKVFDTWNAQIIDQFFLFRSSSPSFCPPYDDVVIHVDLNNSSIQDLDNFYLNRSYYAQVVRNLAAMGTAAQMYDFIFAARSNPSDDRALIDATASAGNVYYGVALALSPEERVPQKRTRKDDVLRHMTDTQWSLRVEGDSGSLYEGKQPLVTFLDLARASRGMGFLSVKPDQDGAFRRVPLLVRTSAGFYPSLPFRAVCDYLSVPPEHLLLRPGESLTLKNARRPGTPPHDVVIPIDLHGNMLVNFIGPWERMRHYSFSDVYHASEDRDAMEMWRDDLAGKLVLISDVSTGLTDIGPVPTDLNFPLSGLHANVVHTILTEAFLREFTGGEMLLVEVLLATVLLTLSLRFQSLGFFLGAFGVALCYLGVAAAAFLYGRAVLQIIRPLAFVGFTAALVTAYRTFNQEKEKAALRRTFEAYFPPAVVSKIMANPDLISSSEQKKELTVLFSDIKNFTRYSSTLTPGQVRRYLNEYFEAMVEIVFSYEGTVDKYIGDGLMVFFGDPQVQPDHALRCVRAAMDMQQKARELRTKWESEGGFPLQIRIGINTGEVVVGNMGSSRRLSYTVLGSNVNLAQRLESNAPVEGIMISARTHELVKDEIATKPLGEVQLKGIDAPMSVFQVVLNQAPMPTV